MMRDVGGILSSLERSEFRRRQKLNSKDAEYLSKKGLDEIGRHARDFVIKRLAPALPEKDGKQTPWHGHPVFVAQHATGTCCRGCLSKWHGIAKGKPLDEEELGYVVEVIITWLSRQSGNGPLG